MSAERPFWAAWGELEAKNASMKLAVVGLTVGCLVLGVGLIAAVRRPPTVVVLPEAKEMKIVRGEDLSERHIRNMGRAFIYTFGNWTYESVEDAYREAMRMLSPKIVAEFDAKAKGKAEEARRSQMSESFIPGKDRVKEGKDGRVQVRIEGVRIVRVGRTIVSDGPYYYEVTLGPRLRDLVNPVGMEIVSIGQGELGG